MAGGSALRWFWFLLLLLCFLLAAGIGGCGRSPDKANTPAMPAAAQDQEAADEPDVVAIRSLLAAQTKMLALLQHVRSGVPLSDIPENNVLATLELTAAQYGLKLPEHAEVLFEEFGRPEMDQDVVLSLTGKSMAAWRGVFTRHGRAIEATLDGTASVWELPDEVWEYL